MYHSTKHLTTWETKTKTHHLHTCVLYLYSLKKTITIINQHIVN